MDEAGRGPVLGPLVFALVILDESQQRHLTQLGVNDSKKLTPRKREVFFKDIIESCEFYSIEILTAVDIDKMRQTHTLNEIEIIGFKRTLAQYTKNFDILYLDAADVNAERFGKQFEKETSAKIISEHKADGKYVSVSAASILAKVRRDEELEKIQNEVTKQDPDLPPVGSGYPNPVTGEFLRAYYEKYRDLPNFARKTWQTSINLIESFKEPKQASLDDF